MIELSPQDRPLLAWSVVSTALEADESGDLHVVVPFAGGILAAVIDGLGHGREAAIAAEATRRVLEEHAPEPVDSLVQLCHEGIRGTRGVVMSLASFSTAASSLTWIGVGNVESMLFRADSPRDKGIEAIQTRGGVVGYRLPPLAPRVVTMSPGDLLVMVTDGIKQGFSEVVARDHEPDTIATTIMQGFSRRTDDALVFVARYLGPPP